MALTINDTAPDFTAQSTEGEISFHEWISSKRGRSAANPGVSSRDGVISGMAALLETSSVRRPVRLCSSMAVLIDTVVEPEPPFALKKT